MDRIQIEEFLDGLNPQNPRAIFDVRTPAEFKKGHIPGANNLPLLSDDERVVVGTAYKQQGRHPAILLGLEYIGPKMRSMVEAVQEVAGSPEDAHVYVHCWRGGMRSGSVAWLLETYGYTVSVLEGGYKSYRRWALEKLSDPPKMLVVGGSTGGGKTEILTALHDMGEAVVDLEGLANHRGSAFGAVGLGDQPTQEHFENMLAFDLARVEVMQRELNKPIWIEDEGRMVGIRHISNELLAVVRSSQVLAVQAPFEDRLERLVRVYGDAPTGELASAFTRIQKRLGLERAKLALEALERGDLVEATRIALAYYDKCYDYGLARREDGTVHPVKLSQDNPEDAAAALIDAAKALDLYTMEER